MMRSWTWWITPFTTLSGIDDAIAQVKAETPAHISPNILLPTHFGKWPQSECRQQLKDMAVSCPEDIAPIRAKVESNGIGFGAWGVPVDLESAELAAEFAEAAGYYSANFEPNEFWIPGDEPPLIDVWWSRFWNRITNQDDLNGNVSATLIPNEWGINAFIDSLPNLIDGCNALALEVYGGLQTQGTYPYPGIWPQESFDKLRGMGLECNLIPIIARDNIPSQKSLANRLGHGNVHIWCI